MRLVCPNCGARYEVPEQNIPESGRDVQCSACSMTWFQTPFHLEKKPVAAAKEVVEKHEKALLSSFQDLQISNESSAEVDDLEKMQKEEDARQPKHRLHPTLAEVLKEEARREVAVRATEIVQMQVNPKNKEIITSDQVLQVDQQDGQAVSSQEENLKKVFHDFEDLRSNTEEKTKDLENENTSEPSGSKEHVKSTIDEVMSGIRQRTRARSLGFLAGLSFVAICFLVYQNTPRLTNAFYPLGPILERYVESVDLIRMKSDQWFVSSIYWLESKVGYISENAVK